MKTYPTFSKKYFELVCTAGINENGEWRRLYPIPFRDLNKNERYRKYQWIEVNIKGNTSDPRPESYKTEGPIKIISEPIDTKDKWQKRKSFLLENSPVYNNISELIKKAHNDELSLAIYKPAKIIKFKVEETDQQHLFEDEKREIDLAHKLPYKFSYEFLDSENTTHKLMIEDWEVGALYWNCLERHNNNKDKALQDVRNKYQGFIEKNDILLFLGTTKEFHIRRAKNPFVIIGVFYPPK